jgi:hypothetical protein
MTPSLIESPRFASAPFPSGSRPRSLALAPTCRHRCFSLRERGFSSPSFRRSERRLSPGVLSPERKATIELRVAGPERPSVRAVSGVPPIVAFRSAKGAFPLRPFAGAKGDDETTSRRGRRPRSSPWRQRAAHRCLSLREKGHFRQAAQALAAQSPVMILARSQGGLAWVIGNVLPQVFILTRTPNKVVERLLLPDLSFFVDRLIDAKGRVMEP